jgi:hypothetical protein
MVIADTAARRARVAAKNAVFLNALDRGATEVGMAAVVFFAEMLRCRLCKFLAPQPALFVDESAPVLVGRDRQRGHVFCC